MVAFYVKIVVFQNVKPQLKIKECIGSLDRIDSLKGYAIDNVQWVHKDINKMKNIHSQPAFINICKLVAMKNK